MMTIPPPHPQPPLLLPQNSSNFFHTPKKQKKNPSFPNTAMNDPRLHLSQTNDHNFKDPFPLNRSRSTQDEKITFLDHEFVQFRPNNPHAAESDDSGVCSPPLWKSSPSTPSSEPLLSHHVYRSLSPASRLQAITRGQKELMEMVKNMPESSYELSLKDLVEHHRIEPHAPPSDLPPRVRRQESKRNMARNGSLKLENKGMLLKMVMPFSLQQPKKRSSLDRSFSGRVSPVKGGGGGEGDWWRKKLGCSSDSDSSRISVNSGGGGGGGGSSRSSSASSSSGRSYADARKRNGFPTGCWPFSRSKNGKIE